MKRIAGFIGVIALVIAAGIFMLIATNAIPLPANEAGQTPSTAEKPAQHYRLKEPIEMTVDTDANATEVEIIDAFDRSGFSGWVGTLVMTVDNATFYDDGHEFAATVDGFRNEYEKDLKGILVLDITVENKDASVPSILGTRDDFRWINIGSIFAQNAFVTYFDGAPADAREFNRLYFDLPQGQTASYRVGLAYDPAERPTELLLGNAGFAVLDLS